MRLFSLLYITAAHTVHVHYFSCVLLVVIIIYIYLSIFYFIFKFTRYLLYFSQLTLKMSRRRMLQSAVRSDQRIAIKNYIGPAKSYLLVFNNLLLLRRQGSSQLKRTETPWIWQGYTKKQKKKGDWQKKKKKKEQIPNFVSGALSLEIRTGNCSKSITL